MFTNNFTNKTINFLLLV